MTFIDVFILALIEGVTEYLPVSSSAQMLAYSFFADLNKNNFFFTFIISIQFGAVCSIVLSKINVMFDLTYLKKIIVAVLPILIIGLVVSFFLDKILNSLSLIATTLIIGGSIMIFFDKIFGEGDKTINELSYKSCFIIGLFQCIAIIPGTSRALASIIGCSVCKLTRKESAIFSFLIAAPTIAAATVFKIWDGLDSITQYGAILIALGNIVSFIISYLTVQLFISWVSKKEFWIFLGVYRILLGIIVLVFIIQK